jgi:hypothetical protein
VATLTKKSKNVKRENKLERLPELLKLDRQKQRRRREDQLPITTGPRTSRETSAGKQGKELQNVHPRLEDQKADNERGPEVELELDEQRQDDPELDPATVKSALVRDDIDRHDKAYGRFISRRVDDLTIKDRRYLRSGTNDLVQLA